MIKRLRKKLGNNTLYNSHKYLGVTLTKQVKDLFDNIKVLKKENTEDLRKWRDFPCSCIGRNNIVKNRHPTKINLLIQLNPYQITNSSKTWKEQFSNLSVKTDNQE